MYTGDAEKQHREDTDAYQAEGQDADLPGLGQGGRQRDDPGADDSADDKRRGLGEPESRKGSSPSAGDADVCDAIAPTGAGA